ncbi:MAG: AAA family ATPase [Microthrixaceae bacterium]
MRSPYPLTSVVLDRFTSFASASVELGDLNVLIGPNGAGKSNFLAVFDMLGALVDRRLGVWFGEHGGPSRVLFGGLKRSQELRVTMKFEQGRQGYEAVLGAADGGTVFFVDERAWGTGQAHSKNRRFAGIAARRLEPRPVPVPAAADRRPVDSPNPGRGAHRRAVLRRLRAATRPRPPAISSDSNGDTQTTISSPTLP